MQKGEVMDIPLLISTPLPRTNESIEAGIAQHPSSAERISAPADTFGMTGLIRAR